MFGYQQPSFGGYPGAYSLGGASGFGATAYGSGLSSYPFAGGYTVADPFAQSVQSLGGYSTVPQFAGTQFGGAQFGGAQFGGAQFGAAPQFGGSVFPGFPGQAAGAGKITLTYFPLKGLAEVIRLLLVEAQVPWDEVAVDNKDFWDQLKPTLTYSQVPVLDIDGKRLYQSRAIANYIARKFGFSGLNADEQYAVDEVLESISDFRQGSPLFAIFRGEADAKEKLSKWKGEGLKKYAGIWSKKFQDNVQAGGRHIVGGSLTVADLALYVALRTWKEIEGMETYLEEFPVLHAFVQSVEARPAISAYYASPRAHPWKPSEELRKKVREITGH